jgi:Sec-independent protein translocase protein TatA
MGPKRIRHVAFWLGKVTAQLQAISRGFTRQLNAELSAIDDDGEMKDAWGEVQDLRKQLADLKREITAVAVEPMAEGRKVVHDAQKAVGNTIRPPHLDLGKTASTTKVDPQDNAQNGETNDLPTIVEVNDDPE